MLFPSFFNASAGGYEIEQSLRFDRASSHYLNETFSAGQTTWTVSFWVKRANLNGVVQCLFGTSTNGFYNDLGFEGSDRLRFRQVYSGVPSENFEMVSTMRFRDPSAWYHIVLSYGAHDGSAAADRAKIWVNNQRLTAFDTANYPGANVSSLLNANNRVHNIGKVGFYDDYLGAYIAEFNFIDGQRLDPTDFGEEDNNGVWRPIKFAGTYGNNNSVYLKFDPTATNGIGHDHSGNGNHFTPSGFTTSGTGTDVMSDTPTTNYATLNPLWARNTYGLSTLSNGNLEFGDAGLTTSWGGRGSTFEISSGKWYMEWKATDASGQSFVLAVLNTGHYGLEHFMVQNPQNQTGCWGPMQNGSAREIKSNGTTLSANAPYYDTLNGQITGIAIDADAGTATWYRNGTAITDLTDIDISVSSKDAWVVMGITSNGSGTSFVANFGQRAFEQTPPTGYSAWNTSNLPAPTVKDGSDYFNTVLYSGNGTSQSLTVGFQPDWIWTKPRNAIGAHVLVDAVRGNTKFLESNSTGAEQTRTGNDGITSFDTNGYSIGSSADWNASGETFVSWNWLAGGTGSSNTDGSITSTVSANPSAGFSIVSYTGTGSAATVGHGLGVPISLMLVKCRNKGFGWTIYHQSLGNTRHLEFAATTGYTGDAWNSTNPTSTVFSVGTDAGSNNGSSPPNNYIAYCFAEVEGYSKFGSYQANNSSDGPFIYCGFKPAFILLKSYNGSTGRDWLLYDSTRSTYNNERGALVPNVASAESSYDDVTYRAIDFLSNGFKLRTNGTPNMNANSESYIFMALAENPFGGSGVSPATAR